MQKCSQVGPKGGRCKNQALVAHGLPLDFCQQHQESVRAGMPQFCSRCDRMVFNSNA